MTKYRVFKTEEFDSSEVGKPLSVLSFFREKKFDGKRLYYLIYSDIFVVLTLAISDKKAQQATINQILLNLAEYQQHVFETLKKGVI